MLINLKAELARKGLKVTDVARVIGRTDRSVRDKINGETGFTLSEATALRDAFFPDLSLEYLFATGNT